MKDRQQELLGEGRVQLYAALRHGIQGDVPFQRDQGPESLAREVEHRVGDLLDLLAALQGRGEEPMTPQLVQGAAQFGLEDHHQRDRQEDRKALEEPAENGQIEKLRDEGQ